jgi:hypothetical protein
VRRCFSLLLFIALAGCGQCGTERFAGLAQWDDDAGEVRVRYLTPPWNLRGDQPEHLRIEVDTITGPDSGVPPKFLFDVTLEAGSATTALASDRAIAAARGESLVADGIALTTISGDHGTAWVGEIPGLYGRFYEHAAFDAPGARVVHVQIESNSDPRTPELDHMLADIDVLPFDSP